MLVAAQAPAPPAERGGSRTPPDIEIMWRSYKQGGDAGVRERLVRHYMKGHVRKLAERLHASLPRQVDLDDLMQEGFLGLLEAIERFELGRNVQFETFSARRIYGAMRDYLRAIDPAPRLTRSRAKRTEVVVDTFRKRRGRPPTEHELCQLLELSRPKFRKLMSELRPAAMVSYQAEAGLQGPETDTDAMSSFEDDGVPSPYETVEHEDLKRWVTKGFSRRDRLIIILYYYEQITMREIGSTLGISESRVSQRLDSILACLRSRLLRTGAEAEFLTG